MVLPQAARGQTEDGEGVLELFVGDDWAEEHHDVELMDPAGRRLARARLPEGVAGMARLHAMIAAQLGERVEDAVVKVGIETDRGPWAQALIAAGYEVFAVNPLQAGAPRPDQQTRQPTGPLGRGRGRATRTRTHPPGTDPRPDRRPPRPQHRRGGRRA